MNNLGNGASSNAGMRKLLRNALLGGASVVAMGVVTTSAMAQDAAPASDNQVETVVVTGIRGSLQRNLDIKRDAVGLIDAITAEDIGKFPDTNLASAMMRIPGVSVSRGASAMGGTGSTSSTGNASEITVRGFGPTFNQTLFDGRMVATGVSNRAFDFSSVSSEFVSQVDVLKTPSPSLASGAIGATINIKFPKPFDHPGLTVAGSLSTTDSPEVGKFTPNGDLIVSDTFAHDTFGILAAVSYNETKTRANHINIQGWEGTTAGSFASTVPGTNPNRPAWFIQDYGIYQEQTDERRIQSRVAFQWRPSSDLLVTLNDNFSWDRQKQDQHGYSVWFNSGSLQNVALDKNGTVINFDQPNTPTDFQGQINGQLLQYNDFGLNAQWTASDNLLVTFDADQAEAWLNPGGQASAIDADVGYGPSGPGGLYGVDLGIAVPGGHNLPYPTVYGPGGNEARFTDASLIGSHVFPIQAPKNIDTVKQAKLAGDWSEGNLDLQFGVQYVGERKKEQMFDTFTNNNWQAYSGYGPNSGNALGVDLPDSMFQKTFSTAGFINGWGGANMLPHQILAYSPTPIRAYLEGLGNPQTTVIPGANTNCCDVPAGSNPALPQNAGRPFTGKYVLAFNPDAYRVLTERTYAGFINATIKTEVAHMPLRINAGMRYELTNVNVVGLGRVPTNFTVDAADHTAYDMTFSDTQPIQGKQEYQHLLPSINLQLSVTDHLDVRFNASQTLTRPPISQLSPTFTVGGRVNAVVANGGNPQLKPFLSDNVDVSTQWYYAPNSYISGDAFLKTVSDFIVNGSTQHTFNGIGPGGTNIDYTLTQPINGPTANVYGFELALQHVFGDTGFGFQLNGTVVGTNKPFNPMDTSVSGFAVTGLADSANFVGFYDKDKLQARVAVNWRDSYLDHFGQLQNNSKFGTEPTFVNAAWDVSFTTSYDITDQTTVYFEAMNLTNATYSTHGRFQNQVLDVVDYGRRFIAGVHFKF